MVSMFMYVSDIGPVKGKVLCSQLTNICLQLTNICLQLTSFCLK